MYYPIEIYREVQFNHTRACAHAIIYSRNIILSIFIIISPFCYIFKIFISFSMVHLNTSIYALCILKLYAFLYALRKSMSQSMNKLNVSLSLPSLPLPPLSHSLFIIPCVCICARRIGGMPRITNHESQSTSRGNQVWNK